MAFWYVVGRSITSFNLRSVLRLIFKSIFTITVCCLCLTQLFGQSPRKKFELGFFANAIGSFPQTQTNSSSPISTIEITNGAGFGLGNILVFRINERMGIKPLIGVEFRNHEFNYLENNDEFSEDFDLNSLYINFQTYYQPISERNIELLLSYKFYSLFEHDDPPFANKLGSFWSALEFGLGYEILLSEVKMYPMLSYSIGVSDIWNNDSTPLGSSISEIKLHSFQISLAFYAGKTK